MKRTAFNVIMSIILILAGFAAQAGGAWGIVECVGLGQIDDKLIETFDSVTELEGAIGKLKDTEDDYYKGVSAIYSGELELKKGRNVVSNGEAVLADGKARVAKAQAQYDEASAKLQKAKTVIAEAEAKMEASRDDYEKGKETIATAEMLMPLLNTYMKFRNGISIIPGVKSTQEWYEARVIPQGAKLGVSLPANVEEFEPFVNDYIAEGKAQLQAYEDAGVTLAEGRKQVSDAETQLAEAKDVLCASKDALKAGQKEIDKANDKLSYAAAMIAEGKNTLEQYDEAVGTLADGLKKFFELEPVYDRSGRVAVEGVRQRLGENFDCYLHNDNGEILALQSGNPRLDYDKCLEVCSAYRAYAEEYIEDVNSEVALRFILDCAIIAAGLLGALAGILALCGKKAARTLGTVLLVLVIACNVFGAATGYTAYTYPPEEDLYAGTLPALASILLLPLAVLFRISARRSRTENILNQNK